MTGSPPFDAFSDVKVKDLMQDTSRLTGELRSSIHISDDTIHRILEAGVSGLQVWAAVPLPPPGQPGAVGRVPGPCHRLRGSRWLRAGRKGRRPCHARTLASLMSRHCLFGAGKGNSALMFTLAGPSPHARHPGGLPAYVGFAEFSTTRKPVCRPGACGGRLIVSAVGW